MQFFNLISIAALAATASATAIERDDKHITDIRLWGGAHCNEENYGVLTVTSSMFKNNQCESLNAPPDYHIRSLQVVDFKSPCTLSFYQTPDCSDERTLYDQRTGDACIGPPERWLYLSYKLVCAQHD